MVFRRTVATACVVPAGLVLGLAIASLVTVQAQQAGKAATQKTEPGLREALARLQALEDKEAIHALLTNYGRTLDGRDFAGFEQLFARDSEYVSGRLAPAKGPAAIRALLESQLKRNAAPESGRDFHLFYNETIEVKGDEATALSKGGFYVRGQTNKLETGGLVNYHDQLIREDGHWKFKRRQLGENAPAAAAPTPAPQ